LIIARLAARRAIVQAILAEADVKLTLAEAAKLLAGALLLVHFTLHTDIFLAGSSAGAHRKTLPAANHPEKFQW
jgi:hypothetical protein